MTSSDFESIDPLAVQERGGWIVYPDTISKRIPLDQPEVHRAALLARYPDLPDHTDVRELLVYASYTAPRIQVPPKLLDYLYKHSREPGISRSAWEKELLTTFAFDLLVRDVRMPTAWHRSLLDEDAVSREMEQINPGKAALILVGHFGFASGRVVITKYYLPGSSLFGNNENGNNIKVGNDPKGALFSAINMLRENIAVVIAPDGSIGSQKSQIAVLARKFKMGDGAAMLAYETRTPIFWLSVGRRGATLIPTIRPGPARAAGEKYVEFKLRVATFYEGMLNEFFSGSPENMAMSGKWLRILGWESSWRKNDS